MGPHTIYSPLADEWLNVVWHHYLHNQEFTVCMKKKMFIQLTSQVIPSKWAFGGSSIPTYKAAVPLYRMDCVPTILETLGIGVKRP